MLSDERIRELWRGCWSDDSDIYDHEAFARAIEQETAARCRALVQGSANVAESLIVRDFNLEATDE